MKRKREEEESIQTSEDFLPELPSLTEHESELRCQICSEFFASPVFLTVCSHSFCSKCIRTHFTRIGSDATCPSCNHRANEDHIRSAPIVELLVASWQKARPAILELREQAKAKKSKPVSHDSGAEDSDIELVGGTLTHSAKKGKRKANNIDDPNAKVACPICQKTLRQAEADHHVSKCLNNDIPAKAWNSLLGVGSAKMVKRKSESNDPPEKYMSRINEVTCKKIDQVREKLQDVNIYDSTSTKDKGLSYAELVKRYNSFVLLYNANQDASKESRKTESDLIRELYKHEKYAHQVAASKHQAKIEGNGSDAAKLYENKHRDMFKDLAKQAAKSYKSKPPVQKEPSQEIEVL